MMSISIASRRRERVLSFVCGFRIRSRVEADVLGTDFPCLDVSILFSGLGLGELAKGSGESSRFDLVGGIGQVGIAGGELAKGLGESPRFDLVGGIGRVLIAGGELANGSELDGRSRAEFLAPVHARLWGSMLGQTGDRRPNGEFCENEARMSLPDAVPVLPLNEDGETRLRLFPECSTRIGSLRSPVTSKSSERNSTPSARDGTRFLPYRTVVFAGLEFESTGALGKHETDSSKTIVKSTSSTRPSKFTVAGPLACSITLGPLGVARFGETRVVGWRGGSSGEGLDEVRSMTSFAIF